MSTNASTEAGIAAAHRIDELLPKFIHARSMEKLWADEGNTMRAMMFAPIDELGVKPGDKWATKAGTIAVTVRAGNMDWEAAYKAIVAAYNELEALLPYDFLVDAILVDAIKAPVPRKADSEPFLTITAAKDLPPPIEQARREGRFEALRRVAEEAASGNDGPDDNPNDCTMSLQAVNDIADEWGGWPEEEEA